MGWAILVCLIIVTATAFLAKATLNMKAALTDKPDIAIYQLLPSEHLGRTELLRESEDKTERWYLAETGSGKEIITLRKGATWYVENRERMHE